MVYCNEIMLMMIMCLVFFFFLVHFGDKGGKFESALLDNAYKVIMKLNIRSVGPADFGSYKCVAKNSLGETDGTIKLYSKCDWG